MGGGPAPFSDIGRPARDLLTKDYNYNQKFSVYTQSSSGMGISATGIKKDQIFSGSLITQLKSGKATIDVATDSDSNVFTKVTYDASRRTKTEIGFKIPHHKSEKNPCGKELVQAKGIQVFTKLTHDVLLGTKAAISFNVQDPKSGKLDVHYHHHHYATISSSIGLKPAPILEVAASIGSKAVSIGGEIAFDTASSSCTKCNTGISFNRPDFSAALILIDKGQTLKASYFLCVNPLTGTAVDVKKKKRKMGTAVAAEMIYRLSKSKSSCSIGSEHEVDHLTLVKTKFSDNGKIAILCQRKWRHRSLLTVSAEYNTRAPRVAPKLGIAISLRP